MKRFGAAATMGLAVLVSLTFITLAIGLVLVGTSGHPERLFGWADHATETANGRSKKLEGATETNDDNGIVYGRTKEGIDYVVYGRGKSGLDPNRISFAATGDVLATDMNFEILDGYAGEVGDGQYGFDPYYKEVAPVVKTYDLSFINQETAMAGNKDGFEYSGYPDFNTPESSLDAMDNAGFNIVNFGSNHSWDMGEQGILNTHDFFAQHPHIMLVGSYKNKRERETVHMVERNGTTIAFLSYVYGSNGFANLSDFPNTYYTCPFDKQRMEMEIHRAQQVADAVVVYMHWGSEYITEPDKQQLEYAQFLADLNVDLVIGSHAHILQPMKYFTSQSGKRIPVIFGLSDFISGWTITDTILSALFTCDFVWKDGHVVVDNLACYPMVEYSDGGETYVRFLKDMSSEDMKKNIRTEDVADDASYFVEFFENLEMDIPVVM